MRIKTPPVDIYIKRTEDEVAENKGKHAIVFENCEECSAIENVPIGFEEPYADIKGKRNRWERNKAT